MPQIFIFENPRELEILKSKFLNHNYSKTHLCYGKSFGIIKMDDRFAEISTKFIIHKKGKKITINPISMLNDSVLKYNNNGAKLISFIGDKEFKFPLNLKDAKELETIISEPEFKDINIRIIDTNRKEPEKILPKITASDAISELKIAKKLFDDNTITEEEYEKLKNRYLDLI